MSSVESVSNKAPALYMPGLCQMYLVFVQYKAGVLAVEAEEKIEHIAAYGISAGYGLTVDSHSNLISVGIPCTFDYGLDIITGHVKAHFAIIFKHEYGFGFIGDQLCRTIQTVYCLQRIAARELPTANDIGCAAGKGYHNACHHYNSEYSANVFHKYTPDF
jgi:hypothetical protein